MNTQILGIGIEIVECARVGRLIERHGEDFLRRVFTVREIAHCSGRSQAIQHYAARWAAKLAVLKAMGLSPGRRFCWVDMEIRGSLKTGLALRVGGGVRSHCIGRRIARTLISASISRFAAGACAVALAPATAEPEIEEA